MEALKAKLTECNQTHLMAHYESLPEDQKKLLLSNLDLDFKKIAQIFKVSMAAKPSGVPSPLPKESVSTTIGRDVQEWHNLGMQAIRDNKVAVILLAGGQGTRLGSSDPKGCYDILLPSHKSLFQLQGERIKKLQELANGIIPWYVMTSGPTRAATEDFFIKKDFFGLDRKNVVFFEQGVLPAFDPNGKIFLESKTSPAFSPDGNGGIYAALRKEGVLKDLKERNRPYVHAYCVDNCLVKVADPVFIGYCIQEGADCAAKCIPKTRPDEQVGVICMKDGKPAVMEYSEIDPKLSASRDQNEQLIYNCANIANHFYTLDFLESVEEFEPQLEYHIAKKAIKHVNEQGELVAPKEKNGIKLELFIFDVFPFTKKFRVLQCAREDEFSPLKNAPGSKDGDSPDTSRADIMAQHRRWVKKAGAKIADDGVFEISPLVSYGGENLESLNGVAIATPKHIETAQDLQNLLK